MVRIRESLVRFLRWSEKYTKTDMVYLVHGSFWSLTGQFAAALSSLAFALVVARFLPKDIYGQYKYVLSVIAILSAFSLSGIGSAVFQSVAHSYEGALQEGFWMNIRWSVLIFLGALGIAIYYFIFHNDALALSILIGGCFSPFLASANLSGNFLAAKKDFARHAIYFDIIANFIPVAALITTVFLTHALLVLIAVYFISNTSIAFYLYWRTLTIYRPTRRPDPGMLSYGKHLSFMGMLNAVANNIDQVILFHYVGPIQLAIYNFATAIPDQTKGPLKTLDSMIQVRFATRSHEDIRNRMASKVTLFLMATLGFVIAYVLIAPFLFKILFPSYIEAVVYSQVYALSLLTYVFTPAASYLLIKKKLREQYISSTAASVFQIASMLVGAITAGLMGLIIARILTRVVGALINYYFLYYPLRSDESGVRV